MKAGHTHVARTRLPGRILCVLWFTLLVSLPARAMDRFDVFLGFDSYVPEASWFPVVCEIENKGPLFMGAVEVSGGAFNDGTRRRVPIELPTGTTKRVILPVFYDGSYGSGWNVRLLNAKGRVAAERLNLAARKKIKPESVLLGSISRNGVWSPPLQPLKTKQQDVAPVAARILPTLLPANPIVLSGLDALYLNSERVTALRLAQLEAIEQWVRAGGHLIVGVEAISDVNASPWLRALVPARLSGVTSIQAHSELQDWIRSNVTDGRAEGGHRGDPGVGVSPPTEDRPFADQADDLEFETADLQVAVSEPLGGRVLVASGGIPLIVQAPHGLGRVTVLMFSPEREPFKSWKSLPAMWSRLTEVPPRWYVSTDQQNQGRWASDGIFGAMIDSRQIRKLPVKWLLLLLVAYLVVIGPFDRWWLRKIGRPMLTWITFPLYVVLFSGLIYVIGYRLRAGEREWNELHVVDVIGSGAGTDLRGRTYGSLYSPVNDTYALRGPERLAALRGEAANAWGGGGSSESIDITLRDDTFESEVYVPVWTSQLYVNDWWTQSEGPLKLSLSETQNGVACRVENTGDWAMSNLRLVCRDRVYDLGDLGAGQSMQRNLPVQQARSLPEYLSMLGASGYQGIVSQRGRAFGGTASGRIVNLPDGCFVASFLGAVQTGNQHTAFAAPPGTELTPILGDHAVLLAWAAGEAAAAPLNQFKASRGQVNTLWRVAVPLNLQR